VTRARWLGGAVLARSAAAAADARADAPAAPAEPLVPAPAHGLPLTVHAAAFVGDGLRFNDPYRLATVLGSSAESVSRTATYVDLAAAVTLGDPRAFQNGFSLHVTLAVEGVQQTLVTPSYVLYRRFRDLAAYARAGTSIVCSPDVTWGLEGALGGVWFVRAGLGVTAEIVGDLFYGAGTREVSAAAYPVLSGQIGLTIAYEVVP
jgi:hypothetical protein